MRVATRPGPHGKWKPPSLKIDRAAPSGRHDEYPRADANPASRGRLRKAEELLRSARAGLASEENNARIYPWRDKALRVTGARTRQVILPVRSLRLARRVHKDQARTELAMTVSPVQQKRIVA
jgi:hypothetical protein